MTSYPGSTALVRAKGFGNLPELVEKQAGEQVVEAIFAKERLPLALRDLPKMPIPLQSMISLFARAGDTLDNRTFGLDVGEHMTHRGYGLWVDYSAGAPTLGEALERLSATSWAHQTGGSMELVSRAGGTMLRYRSPVADASKRQHSDHMLPPMLAFARIYLGPQWRPDWIEVEYPRDPKAFQVEERLQAALRCGQAGTGIVIPQRALNRARRLQVEKLRVVTLREVKADVLLSDAPQPARVLSAVVALRLLDGQSDIEGAAHLVGLGVQGLQRRLREKGYTYREIVDEARRARATGLLLESQMSVLSIALSLGYETHAAFTRAFARWMGCSPSEFRRAHRGPR